MPKAGGETRERVVNTPPTGLYAHLPWCVRKCPYCDFNSHPLRTALPETGYVNALLADLARDQERFGRRAFDTVYFGGGTPSLFSPSALGTVIAATGGAGEVTMEANPGAVEHGDFPAYRRAGVTRISIGAQSFEPSQLARLGRIHDPADTRRVVGDVAGAGFDSFNIDLIHGLPGQSEAAALADLECAIGLAPPHISWYQLTIEPKTEFARRPPKGLPSGDKAAAIEEAGVALLADHGYHRYEVSAYARDGHQCAHNVNYWRFGDYFGIGAGAHGKITSKEGVVRTTKPRQPRLYLAGNFGEAVDVPRGELPAEFLMNALRLTDGVEETLFTARTGASLRTIADVWEELAGWGLLRRDRLALTPKGYRQLDGVVARFL